MVNIVIGFIIILILSGAALYIYKEKKNGSKCIGCPYSKQCNKNSCSFSQEKINN